MSTTASPLIQTKLEAPVPRRVVAREQLLERLLARPARLTIVCAPAGSGKTTLLAEWSASTLESRPFAWVSLDLADNDPALFWGYVIGALRPLVPSAGEGSERLLGAPGVDLVREMLPLLINEIAAPAKPALLVLDDYHAITAPEIHEGMALLVERLPAQLAIVIATRSEPPLPLARLRARGELTEVDAGELSFSEGEAGLLVNDLHGLGLASEDVARLTERTEGWAAGLYLAVLSLSGRDDPHAFIAAFAGDDRHVVDYLSAEVLSGQAAGVKDFLLQTSILDRLCAPLCDAVTQRSDSARLLEQNVRSNFFVLPLDTRREWYRYHHLFGELLRRELSVAQPQVVPELHRRAAAWSLEAGHVAEAVQHTIAAGDHESAGELVVAHWAPTLMAAAGDRTLDSWLSALPDAILAADVRLCFARCFASLSLGRLDEVERWLAVGREAPQPGPFLDGAGSAEGALACVRAALLWERGDAQGAMQAGIEARQAEAGTPWEAIGVATIGLAHAASGEWAQGREWMTEYARLGREFGLHLNHSSGLSSAAACAAELEDWDTARADADAALELAARHGIYEHWCTSHAHLARGLVLESRGDLKGADAALERSVEVAGRGSGPVYTAWPLLHLVRIHIRRGERDAARARLEEARDELAVAPDAGILPERLVAVEGGLRNAPARPASGEALSDRELAVLELLPSGLSQREIGAQLYLSLNTVKTHARHIFRKLGASSRNDAVAKARERGLL